jgi:divalent metal cation (Fe/Co/Zn/Cd) transporter
MGIVEDALLSRARDVRSGVRIEAISVGWMVIEAVVAITAGIFARSVLLTAFGFDSVVEAVSASGLLYRLSFERRGHTQERIEHAEHRATWVAGVGLGLLCVYVPATSALSLATGSHPETSPVGIGLAVVAVIAMPLLVWQKRAIADRIGSSALRADAACSLTCAYMAGTLLVGLGLNAAFHWWWADAVAAVALLYWIAPEAREAVEAARAGRSRCACGE